MMTLYLIKEYVSGRLPAASSFAVNAMDPIRDRFQPLPVTITESNSFSHCGGRWRQVAFKRRKQLEDSLLLT